MLLLILTGIGTTVTPTPSVPAVGGSPSHRPLYTGKWVRRDIALKKPKLSRRERRRLKQHETIARISKGNEVEQRISLPQPPSLNRPIEAQSRVREVQRAEIEKASQKAIKAKEAGLNLMLIEANQITEAYLIKQAQMKKEEDEIVMIMTVADL